MVDNSQKNKRIAKNTFFLYLRMIVVLFVSLFTTRVVLQALGVIDYGIYNVVAGFVSMFSFLNASMSNATQRYYNFSLGDEKNFKFKDVYNTALVIQLILALILILLLEFVGVWYMNNKMTIPVERFDSALCVFHFSVVSLFFVVLQIPYSAAILAYEKMNFYAYVTLFDTFSKLIIAALIAYSSNDRLILYGFCQLAISIITFIIYLCYSKKHFIELRFNFKYEKRLFKSMLDFSGWNLFGSFAYMLKGQGLNVLLNSFFGPVVNAARGISYSIMSALSGFQGNIIVAFRPQLVQSYASKDYHRVKELFYISSKVSFIVLMFLSIPVMLEIDYILNLWLGDNVPQFTSGFTILVLLNMIISSLNTPLSQIVHASGKMKYYQVGTSFIICLVIPISWIFLKMGYNPYTVYIISLIITILNQIVCCAIVETRIFSINIPKYIRKIIIPCLFTLLVSPILPLIVRQMMPSSFTRLIITCVVSVLWSTIIIYWGVLDKKEREFLVNTIKNKIYGSNS